MRFPPVLPSYPAFPFVLALLFAIYGLGLARHVQAVAGGSDSSGYMNNARLLENMDFKIKRREIEGLLPEQLPLYTYVPLGFVPRGDHEMVPTYPMGLPLLILGVSRIVGWQLAANATLVSNAILALVALYIISRLVGLNRPLAIMGTVFLGFSSIFMWMSLQTMSDVPALAWCSLAVLSGMLARRSSSWALLAGAAFSLSVLIRPSSMLMILPLAVLFGQEWRRWISFAIGGMPGAGFQSVINLNLYGSVLTSGYGDISTLFSAHYLQQSATAYALWLPVFLTPAVIFAAVGPLIPDVRRYRLAVALMVWAAAFLGFYAFYFHTSENWGYIRFVLPCFPAIIILMVMVMRDVAERLKIKRRWILGLVIATATIAWDAAWLAHLRILRDNEEQYRVAAIWANDNLPGDAVIVSMQASGALFFYTSFTVVRWDQFDSILFPKIEMACNAAARPIFAILFPFETDNALKIRAPGKWTNIGSIQHVTIWRREQI